MSPPPSPSPPPALPWLLAACCLCALPRGSGFPQPFSRYRDGAELPKSQQLALCFSQWMELSHQPQISSTVLDLCYSIFNSMHTNEVRCRWTKAKRDTEELNKNASCYPAVQISYNMKLYFLSPKGLWRRHCKHELICGAANETVMKSY
ncbi:neuromedin-S isoform X1 [Oxyura jamaicensis]|uniref:neuromedin-S isoform X1 n=1 Tax=Oxyura jamaicensis TaxID=8884 RepID=UPI0015A54920|nr:neuromedin-S isoform X1 [Oxyura jamaicensis]